ncbi:MFS transporter [Micromonospora sp. DT48]|uniref:MFS transporter n=1 Tax=unclassified Micromonospora TaxID=2617518 RepID=UPI0012BC9651|nr:MFS transporter [Micromonospora sp. CP22]MTK03450.1 MFS transporter [Micromonospora sp. CP22]
MSAELIPPNSARAVLRAPQVPLLLAASQVGRLPVAASPIALLLFARQHVSLGVAGLVVAFYTAGMAAGAPVLARAVNRHGQSAVLNASALFSAVGFAVVALGGGRLIPTLAGAAVAGLGTPPLEACLRALWPTLVPAPSVPAAYALEIAVHELTFVVGPLVAVAVVALAGTSAALLVAALLQLAGAAVFAANSRVRQWRDDPAPRHWAGPLRSPRLVSLVLGVVGVGASIGVLPVVVTAYAETVGNRSLAGWLLAAQAAGGLIGGLCYTRLSPGGPARLPLVAVAFSAGLAPLALAPAPPVMALLIVVAGLSLPPLLTVVFLAADRHAPAGTSVEAFAWIITAFAVGSAAGSAAAGALATVDLTYGFLLAPIVAAAAVLVMLPGRVS